MLRNLMIALVLSGLTVTLAFGHCQVPCGIYTDQLRIQMILEDLTTLDKSMMKIEELGADDDVNYNQVVRWVTTKEDHADHISEVITEYFLKQRIKMKPQGDAEYQKYVDMTLSAHTMLVYSMKCKQSTDRENVQKLREELGRFYKLYFGDEMPTEWPHFHPESHSH